MIYLNGREVTVNGNGNTDLSPYKKPGANTIEVKVELTGETDGIIHPLQFICGKEDVILQPWADLGIEWYSGRAVYSRNLEIDRAYLEGNKRLVLDLGKVDYFAEIWVNDSLVTFRPWPPFRSDITGYLHPGTNKISIVVANLLANQASWDILDANIDVRDARWWHNGTIMREKEKLNAGLLGPVRIIPYSEATVHFETSEIGEDITEKNFNP